LEDGADRPSVRWRRQMIRKSTGPLLPGRDLSRKIRDRLKTLLIFHDKPLEMMEEHPVEDGAFGMSRSIYFRHIGNKEPKNAPGTESRADSDKDKPQAGDEMQAPIPSPRPKIFIHERIISGLSGIVNTRLGRRWIKGDSPIR
jgi:hypothetical protein